MEHPAREPMLLDTQTLLRSTVSAVPANIFLLQ
jgi:hypothetical protein